MTQEQLYQVRKIDKGLQVLENLNWLNALKSIDEAGMICMSKSLREFIMKDEKFRRLYIQLIKDTSETFKNSFNDLIKETKERLQKEFDEL